MKQGEAGGERRDETDDEMAGPSMNQWHLDKRVPVSIILAILVQVVTFTILATRIDSRVTALENKDMSDTAFLEKRFRLADERYERLITERDRMARVEEQVKALSDTLRRIEMKIDGASDRQK